MIKLKRIKKPLTITLIIVGVILVILFCFLGIKYIKNHAIIGHYELIEGTDEKELTINLLTWSKGKKEDLKCDLWNCSGYEHGTYKIKGNRIEFHFDSIRYIIYDYEITKDNNQTYLVLKESNAYETTIKKYKKTK